MQKTFLFLYSDWSRVEFPEIEDTGHLHICIKSPVEKKHWPEIVVFSNKFEYLSLVVSNSIDDKYDLSILECFPRLKNFSLSAYQFTDFDQLRYIPSGIEKLTIRDSASLRLSLSFLLRFNNLKELSIEKHKKHIEVLSELNQLEKLAIRSITMPNLEFIAGLSGLRELEIRLGGTKNLDHLPSFEHLEYLELWSIHKISNIDPIADTVSLEHIFLDQMKNVSNIQSLRRLNRLKYIRIARMKGLQSLQWAADAPSLEIFRITETTQLDKEAFKPFVNHKTLRAADIYIGRKNSLAVREMLGLPEIGEEND